MTRSKRWRPTDGPCSTSPEMSRSSMTRSVALAVVGAAVIVACALTGCDRRARAGAVASSGHEQLVALFSDWRTFQKPPLVNGVPQYTAAAMNDQYKKLPEFQHRLASLDASGWTVPQQIDWHLVGAEMNGLDFDHR